jgi:gliding motility-associated-like protein
MVVWLVLISSCAPAMGQIAMPDTVCVGTTRLYHVNDATSTSSYTWKVDGITQTSNLNAMSITWNTSGTFLVTVQEHSPNGCDGDIRSGLVFVKPLPVANAGADASFCFGTTQHLTGGGGGNYQWSPATYLSDPNISNPVVNAPVAGVLTYILNVSANGCSSLKPDTVVITVLPPAKIFAGRDTSITANQPVQLNAIDINNTGFSSYVWSPSVGLNNPFINNPVATLNSDMTYIVTATTAAGCQATDDITIKVFSRADLYVPSAFTPNGDGLNDVLKVIPVGIKELKYFNVYNRWGELVFATKDYTKGWDGIFKGQLQATFTFVWVAEGIDYNGNVISKRGTVTLIR